MLPQQNQRKEKSISIRIENPFFFFFIFFLLFFKNFFSYVYYISYTALFSVVKEIVKNMIDSFTTAVYKMADNSMDEEKSQRYFHDYLRAIEPV